MKEILAIQRRFLNRKGARAAKLLEHKRFRAAYDFMLLRAECGEIEQEVADFWTGIQDQAPEAQKEAFGDAKKRRGRRGRRGGRRGGKSSAHDAAR